MCSQKQQSEPIAIVGSGCRFPGGANSPSSLWKLLESPRDVAMDIPRDRFDASAFYHPEDSHHGTTSVRQSYLLQEDPRLFDASFFNISPNEADAMDPQQRLLLETVYEALEAGGHTIKALQGSDTAVFTGNVTVDYFDTLLQDLNTVPTYFTTGTNRSILSNRISYFFDWHGPSMTIDTACSSSMIAVHQAVKALRTCESRVAVACGTQLILSADLFVVESKMKMLSPTSRGRMWDAAADGYARGEGVVAVVLKRLGDAISDGDHIECIIRETGANQDGHSQGLTVPSPDAQAALIRQTYARAGLNPEGDVRDRPQFFEAHGTGTKAGDPKEASAIQTCFGRHADPNTTSLYVGSIKTVIGHAEASAGLAGLLKGSLMIQKGFIAPNLLFNRLNPDVEPFYDGLQVPTRLLPWPKLPENAPRRVSVNSFGFGGCNAHAILEQYCEAQACNTDLFPQLAVFTPFVFSAMSEASLVGQLQAYASHLKTDNEINASDLAWTLHSRRSQLPIRVTFSAQTIEQLTSDIEASLANVRKTPGTSVGTHVKSKPGMSATPRVLGVFTGQGAQWARMGAQLISSSEFVRRRIQALEDSLATLPPSDRPQWHIAAELLAGDDHSRLSEAALSQPLCTAVQVILVDLLQAAGIQFTAVVGHSSGEIAAAYAAGFISAHDAIRIAYYRGFCARLAKQEGAMLAAGLSWEEAQDFVNLPAFKGRLGVAAHNSSSGVTLSGDAGAILDAQKILSAQKKFSRILKVDMAYHSHHMLPCSTAYVEHLRACKIQVNRDRDNSCAWFSSVSPSQTAMSPGVELQDVYWRDNLTNTVRFVDAVKHAIGGHKEISLALEVGPHPALKGPATQNISEVLPAGIPYSGMLARGKDDIEALSDALGIAWTYLDAGYVDLSSFEKIIMGESRRPKLVVGLPSYRWDHTRPHWNESRISRKRRQPNQLPHEILGSLCPDSNAHDMRWLNVLKISEIPWLEGHTIQGQVLFPAAGYVAMALEASRRLSTDTPFKLIEIDDFSVQRAIAFKEVGDTGVETLVTLTSICFQPDQAVTAAFSCYSLPVVPAGSEQEMKLMASATVKVALGSPDSAALSCTRLEDYNMSMVDPDRFYSSLSKLGYGYAGPFKGMSSMKRRLNQSLVVAKSYEYTDADCSEYLIHPTLLDFAPQSALFAYSAPEDGRLWSLQVPTSIKSIRVNPEVCAVLPSSSSQVPICTVLNSDSESVCACVDMLSEDGTQCMVQIEDLAFQPVASATEADDRRLFTYTKFDVAAPDGSVFVKDTSLSADDVEVATACERIRYHYLHKWKSEITDDEWNNGKPHHRCLREWVDHTLSAVSKGQHPTLKQEWSNDTPKDIDTLVSKYSTSIDVRLVSAVGQHIPAAVRGETSILEHMLKDNMLDDFYQKGIALPEYNLVLASMVNQIIHRYPHARILEIGAGTGGATKAILERIGRTMSSYTYTDISMGFFGNAAELFTNYKDKMTFQVLDIEKEPVAQGYEASSYDIIVASNVLHATASLQATLKNTRQLLKPGGYLLMLEITSRDPNRIGSMMCGLPGWWLGVDDGRKFSPTVTAADWDSVLRKTGFSGIDTIMPEMDGLVSPYSVFATQAVDDRIQFLRRPLALGSSTSSTHLESLVILKNETLESARIANEVAEHLERFCSELTILDGLPTESEADELNPMSTFINLADIRDPIFKNFTTEKVSGLKKMLERAIHVLWITQGAQVDQPYHMASVTFGRAIRNEEGHIKLDYLDFSGSQPEENVSRAIAEHVLRHSALDEWAELELGSKEKQSQILWSREPETLVQDRRLKIPRLLSHVDQNLRLNSSRRVATKTVCISKSNVTISLTADLQPSVERALQRSIKDNHSRSCRVHSSSLIAFNVAADTFLFLGIGTEHTANGSQSVALLSTTNSCETNPVARIQVATSGVVQGTTADSLLIAVASYLIAESLVQSASSGAHILVNCTDTDRVLAAAISRRAAAKTMRVTFVCASDSGENGSDPTWIKLGALAPRHELRRMLRRTKATHFLDVTNALHGTDGSGLGARISQDLPTGCKHIELSALFQHQSSLPPSGDIEGLIGRLEQAVLGAEMLASSITHVHIQKLIVPLDKLGRESVPPHVNCAVQWPLDGAIKVQMRPLDARSLFAADKTYLLIGLTGMLGQSLCEWMISSGAGCVCLASRRPNIDKRWLESFEGTNSIVRVSAVDVTNRNSLESFVRDIRASCPPISGVVNGAMVLHDAVFSNMSLDAVQKVLGPKVDGSFNLDQVFYSDELDFFILLSSAVGVVGNSGQSIYAATCGYVNSLARQRRSRGLAASSLDIGRVTGVGYVETVGQTVLDQLNRFGVTPVSERELQRAFAETIQAGFPDLKHTEGIPQAVVTIGVPTITHAESSNIPWASSPFFSHCIVDSASGSSDSNQEGQKNKTTHSVGHQLSRAVTKEQAFEIIKECFSARLRVTLHLSDQAIDHDAALVELGVDSLVAVEVRSWFLKELKVDVPVLKVIGGASLRDLCQTAMEKLPEELLANIGNQAADEEVCSSSTTIPISDCDDHPSDTSSSHSELESPLSESASISSNDPAPPELIPKPKFVPSKALPPSQSFVKSVPISLGQSRWWFMQLLLYDPGTFNVVFYYRVDGNLRIAALERAVRLVTNRHEALRTCFIEDPTDPAQASQKVLASSAIRLERKKITSVDDVAVEFAKLKSHEFDLSSGKLLRMLLLTLSSSCHYLLFNYHHIIMDGVSFNIFLTDLERAYNGVSLGPPPLQYPDVSMAQRRAFENGGLSGELEYWKTVFPPGEQPPVLPLLPMAQTNPRMQMKVFDTHQVGCKLDPAIAARLRAVAKAQRCTPFHFYMAAYKAMLFLFTDAQDMTIGIADAARNGEDVTGCIGFFLNLLTLRFRRQQNQRFFDAVVEVRDTTFKALEHSRLPFDMLLSEFNIARSSTHSPFFQAFFDYRQAAPERHPFGNCQFDFQEVHPGRTAYDITLDVNENATDASILIRVQKYLYDITAANLVLETFVHLLDILSRDPFLTLESTPLFSERQLSHAVDIGRGSNLISDWPPTLPHRIDQIAQQNPDKIALADGVGNTLTYSEMMKWVHKISSALKNKGVDAGSRVLVFQNASAAWVCSMLAIMRIGAIYVPLDIRNPMPRLSAVANDSEAGSVLVDTSTLNDAPQLKVAGAHIINVSALDEMSSGPLANSARAESPAAILYTSGSTGTPKGIIVTHLGLRNEIEGYTKTWGLGAERVLQQSSFTFNHSSDQIYTGLVNGGMVYIVSSSHRGDPLEITRSVRELDITYTKATPSEYSLWLQYGRDNLTKASAWRFAFGGGEPLTSTVTDNFADLAESLPQLRFFNSYGPTEISISSHKMEIEYREREKVKSMGRIPCGYSLPNYHTYVVDEELRPLPIGMPGELCIGGAGVSLGYLKNQDLTDQHFVPDPFATPDDIANGRMRMYRTGDIGHLQKDGAMVFHNRIAGDTQIKIRGLRIELIDIESNIISASGGALKEAIVTLRNGDPDFLVAHVVFAQTQHDVGEKEAFLERLLSQLPLPQYMIPVVAVPLDKLPLTSHSKVDRRAIKEMPLPIGRRTNSAQEESEWTETMLQLRCLWRNVLGKDKEELGLDITTSTNFFRAGGNSLLVVRLQLQIRQAFNVVIPLVELLGANTLGNMARRIEESSQVRVIDWEKETVPPRIPALLEDVPALLSSEENSEKPMTILITGATGYLARSLLPRLAASPDVGTIHCVAVRDRPADSPRQIPFSPKIMKYKGDLSMPRLGLSADEFRALSRDVDAILHFGGVRSFWDNYHALRATNVHSTKELIQLAAPRRIPIHYISTSGVLPSEAGKATAADAASATAHVPPVDGTEGYVATRWASERILERSATSLGVPSTVYRFLPSTASQPAAPKHLLDEFVQFVDRLELMPDTTNWAGTFDMIPVDEVIGWLCEAVLHNEQQHQLANGGKDVVTTHFLHYESPISVNLDEFTTYLEKHRGNRDLQRISVHQWMGRIKALGFQYFITTQDATVGKADDSEREKLKSRR